VPLGGGAPNIELGPSADLERQQELPIREPAAYSYHPTEQQHQAYLRPQYQQGQQQAFNNYGPNHYGGQQQQQNIYGQQTYSGHQQYHGSYGQQQYGYSSSQYQYRKRRSHVDTKPAKPMVIQMKYSVTKPSVSLVKMMPLLKAMQHSMDYVIVTGNTTMFELRQATDGRGATLHATGFLNQGSKHNIVITGIVRENATKKKMLDAVYRDANKFELKVIVHVV
jgi:hypothetical protein